MTDKRQPRKPAKTPAEVHEDQPQDQQGNPTAAPEKRDDQSKDKPFVIKPLHQESE